MATPYMRSTINRGFRSSVARRLTQFLAVCLLAANLFAPMSLLLIGNADAVGLDDENSIVICTADGFKRISLNSENPNQKTVDFGDCCDSYCPLCQFGQSVHFMSPQVDFYVLPVEERTAPKRAIHHEAARSRKYWRQASVRAPPLSS